MSRDRPLARAFWFLVMDAMDRIGWHRGYLWALVHASDCTDWDDDEYDELDGEPPF